MIFCLRLLQEKCMTDHCICRLHKGIRYSWEDHAVAATEQVWMPREVHNNDRVSTYRNDGECLSWRGSLRIFQCYKWGQARWCTVPHALLLLTISNARPRFQRHGDGVYIQSRQSADQRRTLQREKLRLLGYW